MQEIRTIPYKNGISPAHLFAGGFVAFCAAAAVLIGSFPLTLSIATIFLFAGVHNFMEFRYFLARMPVRWGRSKVYYTVGIGGTLVLTFAYLAIYLTSGNWLWSADGWLTVTAVWNTGLILWVGLLFYLRGRQKPRSDWSIAFAAAFLLAAFAWLSPAVWSLSLVYLHPFIAMWFLERQIRRSKPEWLRAYHFCLLTIPLFLILLWFFWAARPDVFAGTGLFRRITQHAGKDILPGISSHLLVAVHVFLETIHYMVWILLIPLVDRRAIPWKLKEIPAFANKNGFPKLVSAGLAFGVFLVLALWFGFALDYTLTRDIYFAFAMAHVLAEFPFLVKML